MLLPQRLRPSCLHQPCLCSRGVGWAPARAPSSAPSPARGLPPLSPAGGRQRRCSSAHYFKSPEYDLTRTESHSERERERASERKIQLGTGPLRKHSVLVAPAWGPHPGHFKRTQVTLETK